MENSVYFEDLPLEQAQERFFQALREAGLDGLLGREWIPLDEQACGRILSAPVWAKISSPHYHASAMDGFALKAADTRGAAPSSPVTLHCGPESELPAAVYVDTGDALPEWADAVVPIEQVEPLDQNGQAAELPRRPFAIRLRAACVPWQHIRPLGEDIIASQLVLPSGHRLRPVDLGAVAASGHSFVQATRKPRVAIIPTGSELVPVGGQPRSGEIIEYNSLVIAAQVNTWGGEAIRFPITPDQPDRIFERLTEAAQNADLVLILAGSSAGSEDYTARVVERAGRLLVHGVAVRPGHPVIIGLAARPPILAQDGNTSPDRNMTYPGSALLPVIGVPGYPVSAALTGEIFVEPLLARWCGRAPASPATLEATLTRKLTSPAGDIDYIRVVLGQVGDKILAAPLARGSGVITSLVQADGLLVVPAGIQGYPAGERVSIRLIRSPAELNQTILAVGSHDMTLDILAQFLSARHRRLVSSNVGSQAGLAALKRGEAHLAGSHLLDPIDGSYNLRFIQEYLPDLAVSVVAFVDRQQGLMVRAGNPKQIHSLADLARPDVSMVNRQRGAGTRVLLDYHLKRAGLEPGNIQGYQHEQYTHLAVAAAVASGRADTGLGIAAAAQALELDFIPLFQESYQLIIPQAHIRSELLEPLLAILEEPAFRQAVAEMPGYNVAEMGKIVAQINPTTEAKGS